jgi:hypothetical protein
MVMWGWAQINGAADAHDQTAVHVLDYGGLGVRQGDPLAAMSSRNLALVQSRAGGLAWRVRVMRHLSSGSTLLW